MIDKVTVRTSRFAFPLVWGGQAASLLLSGATAIALSVWLYEETGSAVVLATVVAVKSALSIYASPFTGRVVDRVPRKRLIIIADIALGASSLLLLWLTSYGTSALGAMIGVVALTGLFDSLLLVSLAASVRDVRSEANLTRTNGLVSLLEASPTIVAPLIGAGLYQAVGVQPVLIADAASFGVAAALAAAARWRSAAVPIAPTKSRIPFRGATEGLRLIFRDGAFARLQVGFAGINALTGLGATAVTAYILSSAQGGATVLGLYSSIGAAGLFVGAALVAALGHRLPRSKAIVGGLALAAVGGRVLFGAFAAPAIWLASSLLRSTGIQLSNAPLTALWQEQTARSDQGKVFGARRLLGQGLYPVAVLCGGVLADGVHSWSPDMGLALLLISLGLGELFIAVYIQLSGAARKIVQRRGVFISSQPGEAEADPRD